MNKRLVSALLAAVLAIPGSVPAMTLPVAAQTELMAEDTAADHLIYSNDETLTINNGSGPVAITDADQVTPFANLESMTFETTFTCTASSVRSLFFIGDSTQQRRYMSVYVNGTTLGIEVLNDGGSTYSTSKNVAPLSFTQPHVLWITFEANSKICFYIDGEKVHEANMSTKFVKDVLSNVNFVGFGNGARSGGQNSYPFTGTLGRIRVYDYARSAEELEDEYYANLQSGVYSSTAHGAQSMTALTQDETEIAAVKDLTEGS